MTSKKAKRAFETFVEQIPDDKLQVPFSDSYRTIYTDKNFRLDMQGRTAGGWNLQIQANLQSSVRDAVFENPGGLDVERLSIRSNKSSIRSLRGAKEKATAPFRRAARVFKS